MIFALAEIALTITWHVSTISLRLVYNGVYYLYYGTQISPEELSRQELEEKIEELREKVNNISKVVEKNNDNKTRPN